MPPENLNELEAGPFPFSELYAAEASDVPGDGGQEQQPSNSGEKRASKSTRRKNAWGYESYAELIERAIVSSAESRMALDEIYGWLELNVEHFRLNKGAESSRSWKNSIRHNLSLHQRFIRIVNPNCSRVGWWTMNPDPEARNKKKTSRRKASNNSEQPGSSSNNSLTRNGKKRGRPCGSTRSKSTNPNTNSDNPSVAQIVPNQELSASDEIGTSPNPPEPPNPFERDDVFARSLNFLTDPRDPTFGQLTQTGNAAISTTRTGPPSFATFSNELNNFAGNGPRFHQQMGIANIDGTNTLINEAYYLRQREILLGVAPSMENDQVSNFVPQIAQMNSTQAIPANMIHGLSQPTFFSNQTANAQDIRSLVSGAFAARQIQQIQQTQPINVFGATMTNAGPLPASTVAAPSTAAQASGSRYMDRTLAFTQTDGHFNFQIQHARNNTAGNRNVLIATENCGGLQDSSSHEQSEQ